MGKMRSYRFLLHSSRWSGDVREVCKAILETVINDEDKFQVGRTKIFLRAGQVRSASKILPLF